MLTRSKLVTLLVCLVCWPALAWGQQEMRSASKGASTPLPITGSAIDADHNALDVKCLSGCSGSGGGGDASAANQTTIIGHVDGVEGILTTIDADTGTIAGAVKAEDAAHSSAHTGIPFWGVRNDSGGTTFTDTNGDYSPIAVDNLGRVFITQTSIAPGTAAGHLGKAEDAAHTSGDTGVLTLCVRQDTAAALATTNGDYIPCATDATGRMWTNTELPDAAALADGTSNPTTTGVAAYNMCYNGTTWDRCVKAVDPCQVNTKVHANINGTAGATLVTGTASKKIYLCSINIVTATAQNINLVSGTGTVCATSTAATLGLTGGTTAGTGWNFAANGGLTLGSGGFSIGQTNVNADNLCMLISGSGQVTGGFSYVVQ